MLRLMRRGMETGLKNYRVIPRPYLLLIAIGTVIRGLFSWIPAFAGMTLRGHVKDTAFVGKTLPSWE